LPILAQKLSRIGDWGGSNLDANSLQSGSVLDAIQQLPLPLAPEGKTLRSDYMPAHTRSKW
jgi:hypothetical protein